MVANILSTILLAAVVAILPGIGILLAQGIKWLQARTNNELLKTALGVLDHFAATAVQQLQATLRPKLETSDGGLLPVAAQQLQQAALASVKQSLLKEGSAAAQKALSLGDGFLTAAIESALASVKRADAVAQAAPVAAVPVADPR